MHDPRAVANHILDEGEHCRTFFSNLALQKLLYFAHAISLVENKKPLVNGYFEAWRFGPVHPVVNKSFKCFGAAPIVGRATAFDPVNRIEKELQALEDSQSIEVCGRVVRTLGRLSVGRLVELSHARGGPWDHVVSSAKTSSKIGLRIPDSLIVERHVNLKVVVGDTPKPGEPYEDAPYT
jgi:uncharacterized phage-associated protein